MNQVLVIWKTNWSDEMDIEGFKLMNVDQWNVLKKTIIPKNSFSIYVGTNEEIEYSTGEELLKELHVKKINPDEVLTIKKLFGESFGFTEFLQIEEDEEDEEDEEYLDIEEN